MNLCSTWSTLDHLLDPERMLSSFLYLFQSCGAFLTPAEEVVNLTSRRLSVSPSCASSNSHRNYSFRRGSVWSVRSLASAEGSKLTSIDRQLLFVSNYFRLPCLADEENTTEHTPTHHMLQPPQSVFPACICAAVLPIVHLMEDGEVREDGVAGGCCEMPSVFMSVGLLVWLWGSFVSLGGKYVFKRL